MGGVDETTQLWLDIERSVDRDDADGGYDGGRNICKLERTGDRFGYSANLPTISEISKQKSHQTYCQI